MKKAALALAAALIAASCSAPSGKSGNSENGTALEMDTTAQGGLAYHLETMETSLGYGYTIAVNGKKVIVQDVIPVIQGNAGFKTPEMAFRIGKCAVRQMASGMMLPSISREDLIMNGIIGASGQLL